MLEGEYLALNDSIMHPCSGDGRGAGGHGPPNKRLGEGTKCLRGAKLLLKQTAYEAYEVLQKKV